MTFNNLISKINKLKRSRVKRIVKERIKKFEKVGTSPNEIFKELCFCILTANFNAERAIEIQRKIGNGFLKLGEKTLAVKLKKLGHRFPNMRAKYIIDIRKQKGEIINQVMLKSSKNSLSTNGFDEIKIRDWLVKNVKGLGYKEASHFLRNIGYKNLAIIDFHILDLLVKNRLLKEKPKTLTKNKYLEIENILRKLAQKLHMTPAELDLYLWYLETGKIVK